MASTQQDVDKILYDLITLSNRCEGLVPSDPDDFIELLTEFLIVSEQAKTLVLERAK